MNRLHVEAFAKIRLFTFSLIGIVNMPEQLGLVQIQHNSTDENHLNIGLKLSLKE